MAEGYSGTPLAKKLGIREGFKMLIVNIPDHYYQLFEDLPENVSEVKYGKADFIHFFTKESKELKTKFPQLKKRMEMNSMIWVSWPKKASKVPTTVDEALVRKTGLDIGLVDIKICAVDETWSGLKFVYRLKDRKN